MEFSGPNSESYWVQTRLSLLSRVKDLGDERSWREFFDIYWKLIHNIAIKSGLSQSESEEVVQEVFVELAKQLPEFQYDPNRGSFKNWLKTLVGWKVVDQIRVRATSNHVSNLDPSDSEALAPPCNQLEKLWESEWKLNLIDAALKRVRHQSDPRQYQAFDLAFQRNMPAVEVAKTLGMSLPSVYLAKHRIHRRLRAEIKELESQYEQNAFNKKESF